MKGMTGKMYLEGHVQSYLYIYNIFIYIYRCQIVFFTFGFISISTCHTTDVLSLLALLLKSSLAHHEWALQVVYLVNFWKVPA